MTFIDDEDLKEPWKRSAPATQKLAGVMPKSLTLTLANLIYFEKEQLPQAFANRLIRLAAFQNPEFYKAQAMRMSVWDKPRVIGCAENYPDGRFTALDKTMRRVGATGESIYLEQIVPRPDGEQSIHLIRIIAEPGSDGRTVSVLAVGRDVTVEKRNEEELRLAASVFHNSSEGVLVTDADTVILSVNPGFSRKSPVIPKKMRWAKTQLAAF